MKSQNNNETIGDKIKQLRNKQGLTQDELARKADLPYTTLTKQVAKNIIKKLLKGEDYRIEVVTLILLHRLPTVPCTALCQ